MINEKIYLVNTWNSPSSTPSGFCSNKGLLGMKANERRYKVPVVTHAHTHMRTHTVHTQHTHG